jgi:hypothetical protein
MVERIPRRMVTVIACNAIGTDKLPPLVIRKNENPCCFKNVRKLPTNV